MDHLPLPGDDARRVSEALAARIGSMVDDAGGWVGFDRFMNSALYEPALGYYSGGSRRFGLEGDFTTAPELTPLFGHCVAQAVVPWLSRSTPQLIEFGAGTGQLAAQVLNALARHEMPPDRYLIVELSPALRRQQEHTLALLAPGMVERVGWLDALPDTIDGVVLANEVLDAMPVRLFELRQRAVFERGLVRARDDNPFAWQSRRADPGFAHRVRLALARAGWGGDDPDALDYSAWPQHYLSELSEQAEAWVRSVGERLRSGVMLLIDYGFPSREFYHPQRATGTLVCHYRHRVHDDPLWFPGLQDITAHVDFSAVLRAGEACGLELLGYTSQANFLLGSGLLDALGQLAPDTGIEYARQAQAVQKLVSEAEMGELVKVIALGRGMRHAGAAFDRGVREP